MTKTEGIKNIFAEAAGTYDLANLVLTAGLDRRWRRQAAHYASSRSGDGIWLDVNSGTGDMAIRLWKNSKRKARIIATDFSPAMIDVARRKAKNTDIEFKIADSGNLPFENNSVDLVIISFATRNLNTQPGVLIEYFREFKRVLKPGGVFINLETTVPPSKLMKYILYTYARFFVAPLGYLISRSAPAYKYLSYTIRHFYTAGQLKEILYKAGFKKVDYFYLTFGLCAVHTAEK